MFRVKSIASLCMASALALGVHSGVAAASAGGLVAHRAVYNLELKEANERSGIEGMYGRMVYEFNGSACDGYTVSFRYVTQIKSGDETRMTDQQTKTFEDLNSRTFTFETKNFTDAQMDKEIKGEAVEEEGGMRVALETPDPKEVELSPGRFPTEHMLEVISRAKRGDQFFESRVFDGSEDGDKTMMTTTIVGKSETPQKDDPDADKAGVLKGDSFWPVTMAYYDDESTDDALPVYRISFKLYENGVTRDLTMDYGDFVLTGKLANLEMLPQKECKK